MMRKILLILVVACVCLLTVSAQEHGKGFSPEKFDAELRQFIIQEAGLTADEVAKFFPLYNEMRDKQRELFMRQRKLGMGRPSDESACKKAIQERDDVEVEQKRVQQTYHNKFLCVLSASKVYKVIQAEDRFHRKMLRQWGHRQKQKEKKKD